jgi:lysophospholipase L1-like esterase
MKERLFDLNRRAFIPHPLAFVLVLLCALVACDSRISSSTGNNNTMMTSDKKDTAVAYVAVGDSTGVGVGAQDGGYPERLLKRIRQEHEGARLVNLCVSGATTADLLREQLKPAIAARPTLITIGIGINDLGSYVPVETFARNFEEIVKRLKTGTSAAIVVSNLPDISFAPVVPANLREQTRSQINLFNARIHEIAGRYKLSLVDAYTETHATIPAHPEFFSDDGFHPSDAGYEYWAKTMWPAVKAAVGE